MNEGIQQTIFFDWIRTNPKLEPYVWHIANERECTPLHGRMLKRQGVKKGAPDIVVMLPRNGFHGAIIEMKWGKNKLTKEQAELLEFLRKEGYATCVPYSAKEAADFLKEYIGNSMTLTEGYF